ncbi:hypothetical protein [Sulfitobacter sp. JL08]|uniref:hypothetical protein n=1 Tax=Sulfitobacter sp. JL08 TaxID=2070369 RepID=UPI0013B46A85|nr:hypothetical protein [Sulfitobacter sp. JL08]
MNKKIVLLCLALVTAGCDITQPVAVISPEGRVLKGTTTASTTQSGSFQVSDGKLTCAGTYDAYSMSESLSFPVTCNNGMKGLGTVVREASGMAGSGSVRMTDGTDWTFVFGSAVKAF